MTAARPASRLQARLEAEVGGAPGAGPFAAVAAAVLLCRGLLGLDTATLARRLRLPTTVLADLEAGRRPGWTVPRRLAEIAPDVDWPRAGVEAGTPTDRARRHPAAHRPASTRAGDPP